jgi:hypothetical protein
MGDKKILNTKAFELPIHGGTPFEHSIALDPSLPNGRRYPPPSLIIKISELSRTQLHIQRYT